MNTPDTEVGGMIEKFERMVDVSVKPSDSTRSGFIAEFDPDYLKEYFAVALTSRDTYWKERVAVKDDLLDDMWGLICNVNGGIVEKEKEEWYQAFLRIRTKYFTNLDNLK